TDKENKEKSTEWPGCNPALSAGSVAQFLTSSPNAPATSSAGTHSSSRRRPVVLRPAFGLAETSAASIPWRVRWTLANCSRLLVDSHTCRAFHIAVGAVSSCRGGYPYLD